VSTIELVQHPEMTAHACIAMAHGVSFQEALDLVGKGRHPSLARITDALGVTAGDVRFKRIDGQRGIRWKPRALFYYLWQDNGPAKRFALFAGGQVFDPALLEPCASFEHWRSLKATPVSIRGWIPLRLPRYDLANPTEFRR
jgi:hypothetical protein